MKLAAPSSWETHSAVLKSCSESRFRKCWPRHIFFSCWVCTGYSWLVEPLLFAQFAQQGRPCNREPPHPPPTWTAVPPGRKEKHLLCLSLSAPCTLHCLFRLTLHLWQFFFSSGSIPKAQRATSFASMGFLLIINGACWIILKSREQIWELGKQCWGGEKKITGEVMRFGENKGMQMGNLI